MRIEKTGTGASKSEREMSKIKFNDAYWIDENGEKKRTIPKGKEITLYVETEQYQYDNKIILEIEQEKFNSEKRKFEISIRKRVCFVDENGKCCLKKFKL